MATMTSRIGPADHGRAMTQQEFLDAEEEEGFRYELARGVLEVTEVPNDAHGKLVCFFYDRLAFYRREHPRRIDRYGGGNEFRLWVPGMGSGRNPDVAVALRATPLDVRGRRPASLVVEIVSEGAEAHDRDYNTKRDEYLAYGLREYWIVDPILRRVAVLVRDGDIWVERTFAGDQAAEGLVLPGFAVRLPELWAAAEEDGEEGQEAQG